MADKNDIRRTAESRFAASENRDREVKSELAKQSAAFDARTIKLRAQRMAVEEEARVEKERLAVIAAAKPAKTPRKKAAR